MLEIKNLELEKRSFWFVTRNYNGKDYFLKSFKENINGAYWISDYNLAAGFLNQIHALKIKDDHFSDRDEITIVEHKI